ncbi:MAG: hypothetical protein U9N60_05965 [Thermodesulfobacteriota bacterium]|nr:hypothetical protein [Thermodesulfobacteriota bacterium]
MCDFDDFDYDGLDDMDDDFIEDALLDKYDEYNAPDMETELPDELNTPEPEPSKSSFDMEEVFILGGMIAGLAWEDALDEKEQRKKKKPK